MLKDLNAISICSDLSYLRSVYDYDPLTGHFTYKVSRGPMRAGRVAGAGNKDGYIQIRLNGRLEYAHRAAFLWMTGNWPAGFVDHKDTDRSNNVWENLRDTTRTVNNRNKSIHSNNTSGIVGVSWDSSRAKWVAHIGVNGKCIRLGRFTHKEDAVLARLAAEKRYGYWVDKVWDSQ